MIVQAVNYLGSHFWSIFSWAMLGIILWRLTIGIISYQTGMKAFKSSLLAIVSLVGAFIYLIFPVDIIPDVIALIGWVDDAVIVVSAFTYAQQAASKMFWGEQPVKHRFRTFFKWLGIFMLISWIANFSFEMYL